MGFYFESSHRKSCDYFRLALRCMASQYLGFQPTDCCRVLEGVRLNRFTFLNTGDSWYGVEVRCCFRASTVPVNGL